MTSRTGILIDPRNRSVTEVAAREWNADETLTALDDPVNGALCYWDVEGTDDFLVVSDFLNAMAAGASSRFEGFRLYGKEYFGHALILAREPEAAPSPKLSLREVRQAVTFFLLSEEAVT